MNKKLLFLLLLFTCAASAIYAQAPQQFNYQGALRNADGSAVANKSITLRLSILNGSENGASQYTETRRITTSSLGLYNVAIGSAGALTTTNNFSAVDWAAGLKYLKVEADLNNGTTFVSAGTSQLLSVPYALYAANSSGGAAGKSAYQIWLDAGNTGSVTDFLNSLKATGQTASGDLAGTYPQPSVVKIQGVAISSTAPTAGQVLRFNGTNWEAATPTGSGSVVAANTTTSQPDVISLTNGTGATLTNMGIALKPGAANTYLVTDENQQVKWQTADAAGFVSGKVSLVSFGVLENGTTKIPANDVAKVKVAVTGAKVGNTVFISNATDETEFSIITSWVSAPNEVSVRLANYQPVPVDITGRQYKVLLVQN